MLNTAGVSGRNSLGCCRVSVIKLLLIVYKASVADISVMDMITQVFGVVKANLSRITTCSPVFPNLLTLVYQYARIRNTAYDCINLILIMTIDPLEIKRKVTMRDVAKAANVSQSTVSRILSPSPSAKSEVPISEETKEKVLAVVKELGYQPNQYARSLRGQKNHVIGMLIADISNPFYHPMVRAVQDVASHYHYSVMIANSDHLHEKEQLFCESLL